ncbi:hypothetical protein Tco_1202869 [Tanacetum coccineum]
MKEAEVAHDETEHEESVPTPSNDPLPSAIEITSLKKRVDKLEKRRKFRTIGLKRLKKVGAARRIEISLSHLRYATVTTRQRPVVAVGVHWGGLRRTNSEQKLRCGSSWVTWSRPCHKVVRLGINPMIQPEPEDLPKDNPKLEIAVLSEGVEELKGNVWIKGVNKEALHTT